MMGRCEYVIGSNISQKDARFLLQHIAQNGGKVEFPLPSDAPSIPYQLASLDINRYPMHPRKRVARVLPGYQAALVPIPALTAWYERMCEAYGVA